MASESQRPQRHAARMRTVRQRASSNKPLAGPRSTFHLRGRSRGPVHQHQQAPGNNRFNVSFPSHYRPSQATQGTRVPLVARNDQQIAPHLWRGCVQSGASGFDPAVARARLEAAARDDQGSDTRLERSG
jgi:hypothetical protein